MCFTQPSFNYQILLFIVCSLKLSVFCYLSFPLSSAKVSVFILSLTLPSLGGVNKAFTLPHQVDSGTLKSQTS